LLITRIVTGVAFGVVVTASVLFLNTPAFALVLGALWLAGAWEWAGFARLGRGARVAYTGGFAVVMLAAWFHVDARLAVVVLIAALLWWLIALGAVLTFPRPFGLRWVAALGPVVLLPSWLFLARTHGVAVHGHGLVMTLLAIVWAADVGAYTFGRAFGRFKLAPAVSPGKTWEGLGGGLVAAAAAAWVAAILIGLPAGVLLGLGVVTALASVVGDLAVSVFKRNVGLKDTGTLLPGHGGVMDRIDSLTAAVPVFVLGLMLARIVA
jgi:phosphatidate cytidylyltransferase